MSSNTGMIMVVAIVAVCGSVCLAAAFYGYQNWDWLSSQLGLNTTTTNTTTTTFTDTAAPGEVSNTATVSLTGTCQKDYCNGLIASKLDSGAAFSITDLDKDKCGGCEQRFWESRNGTPVMNKGVAGVWCSELMYGSDADSGRQAAKGWLSLDNKSCTTPSGLQASTTTTRDMCKKAVQDQISTLDWNVADNTWIGFNTTDVNAACYGCGQNTCINTPNCSNKGYWGDGWGVRVNPGASKLELQRVKSDGTTENKAFDKGGSRDDMVNWMGETMKDGTCATYAAGSQVKAAAGGQRKGGIPMRAAARAGGTRARAPVGKQTKKAAPVATTRRRAGVAPQPKRHR